MGHLSQSENNQGEEEINPSSEGILNQKLIQTKKSARFLGHHPIDRIDEFGFFGPGGLVGRGPRGVR